MAKCLIRATLLPMVSLPLPLAVGFWLGIGLKNAPDNIGTRTHTRARIYTTIWVWARKKNKKISYGYGYIHTLPWTLDGLVWVQNFISWRVWVRVWVWGYPEGLDPFTALVASRIHIKVVSEQLPNEDLSEECLEKV
ncbi:hypothetical protein M9H77_30865 [Catharanthus roseus]|uniref:Uncharacterized protein n=1 Tax=Catharanthus roseus TaxID=4058 RepID=A0ACC0A2R2_CATRO|nr:hypothetical protein M9H77_30865 [Catharanthus roseus]